MKKGIFYIILAGVLWGTSGIFVNILSLYGFDALMTTALRGLIASLVMGIYIFAANKKLFKANKKELLYFISNGMAMVGTSAFYFASIRAASVSTAVILMYTAPVFVMIYSVSFLGEKLNLKKGISVVLMLIGCALVSGIVGGMKFSTWGITAGLLAGISYSTYNILTKIEMKKGYNAVSATLYSFISMTVVSFIISKPLQIFTLTSEHPLVLIPLIIALGIVTCVLPYLFYTLALKELPVGTASSLAIVEPLAATFFSFAVLGESLSIYSVAGGILILSSVYILSKFSN